MVAHLQRGRRRGNRTRAHALLRFLRNTRRRPAIEGKYVPFEVESPDWNGLVQYTWDFGDATPLVHEATPWHAYTLPVPTRFRYRARRVWNGRCHPHAFTVVVDEPPEAREIYVPENIFAGSSISFDADVFDAEAGSEMEIYRDLDVEDGSITERDERILTQFTVRWDFDIEADADENGNPADDWVTPIAGSSVRTINTWEATGFYTVLVEVCDGMGQCDILTEDIEVVPSPMVRPPCPTSALTSGNPGWPMRVPNWRPSLHSSWWPSSWDGS